MASISSTTLGSLTGKTTAATKKAADTYNQFLNLLTTQLKNQDPLDPMKSEEFTNQLVQFSQVEQAILSNEKLDTLNSQINNTQIGQSLGYIGKNVYYKGDTFYNEGDPLKIGYAIDGDAKTASMRIIDKNGQTIRTLSINPGSLSGNLEWDGKDEFGNVANINEIYSVRVDALDTLNAPIKSYTGVPGHVNGVETTDGVLYLALKGDRRIDATNVLSISEADS